MSNIMEYIVQMSQQMKDLAEDGDTKLNQVLERLDELERLIAELRNKMV
jgi:polyhydroxyalkanoate synthesis regulator phasin